MRVVRLIVYEGSEQAIARQMRKSLRDGQHDLATKITVTTLSPDPTTLPQGISNAEDGSTEASQQGITATT